MFSCLVILFLLAIFKGLRSEVTPEDLQFLNELPLDKLLRMKNSLQELVPQKRDNTTISEFEPSYLQRFGAQALAQKGPPIKRTDFEDGFLKKHGHYSKISSIFSMSVSTLAFLAFGGYLLCLIVHAMKSKQMSPNVPQPTFFVSAGIKKRPQPQFASYGRRKREIVADGSVSDLAPPPEVLFSALLQLCEGYAKWNKKFEDS